MNQKIFYTSLKTPAEKVRFLIKIASEHFQKNQKIIIYTADHKTAEFVDNLLWSEPKEGFLPHFISQTLIDECIVITCEKTNLNQAKFALNLSMDPLDLVTLKLTTVLEIEDRSSPEKLQVFKKKLHYYQKNNFQIVTI
jgi:DNA polymerase-3 subunit chi